MQNRIIVLKSFFRRIASFASSRCRRNKPAPPAAFRNAWFAPTCALIGAVMAPCSLPAQVNVLTFHNDNARTGQNLNETILTQANVNTNTFGLLFSAAVDGQIYGQPLYMAAVAITNKGTHNVVFVATENDSVYAFDADNNVGSNGAPLWKDSFINPSSGVTTVPAGVTGSANISPVIGITSTPVIDSNTLTLYVEAKTQEISGTVTNYVHRLHALDIGSGAEKFSGPVVISPAVPGMGQGNNGAGLVPFDGLRQLNRPGLLLANGVVYVAYASHGDTQPYHGWVLGFNAQTLQPQGVFNATPNGGLGGVWEGGDGPATDDAGNIYIITGNGSFDSTTNKDYADSYIKLTPSANNVALADYFTPYNQQSLANGDLDAGSGGLIVLPDSVGSVAHPHLAAGAGKDGIIHLVDRDNLGHFNSANDSQTVQSLSVGYGSYSTPAYFGNTLYYIGAGGALQAYSFSGGLLATNPASASITTFPAPGASPSISASGSSNGIVWALEANSSAILHAFNATNVALELYNSQQAGPRDATGPSVKFAVPTVVNGKVYVGAASALYVFGHGLWSAAPNVYPNGGIFTNSITVTLSNNSPGSQIYYTLDGSMPTTNSPIYSTPLTLTNTTVLLAISSALNEGISFPAAALFIPVSIGTTVAGFGGDGSGWTLNGGAVVTNDVITLTDGLNSEARSAFFNSPQSITPFNVQFIYKSTGGADGTAFVLQNASSGASALGGAGGCLGYCGISPSAAVEFNLYSGNGGTGTTFATNGVTGNYTSTLPLNLGSEDPIWVTLSYDGTNLMENLVDLIAGQTYDASYAVNLSAAVGGGNTAFIGLTAGTGGDVSRQTVSDFIFTLRNPPAAAPAIMPDGAIFTNSISVTLSTPTPGAQIYYTLNGATPTTNSILYTSPFTLTNTTAVKAVSVAAGLADSDVAFSFFGDISAAATGAGFGGNGAGWTLNGAPALANNVITLTDGSGSEARSAFFDTVQVITNFIARFIYQSSGGADGTTFVLQNDSAGPGALGSAGGCLAYCGITPSAAIEFNLYSGQGGTGTRFATNGVTDGYTSTLPLNLGSGHPIWVVLNYDGSVLTEHLVDQNTGDTFDAAYAVNLARAVGGSNTAWVGITGADGGVASIQTVTGFTFGPNGPAPLLSAGFASNQITITWTVSPLNYGLEFTTNLNPPVIWSAASQTPVISGGQATVSIPIGPTNTFYRLRVP
jgi:Chitobiase/beta-hexosaminidase C-terminal domain/Bacterial lectin